MQPRFSADEVVQRGQALYDRQIRTKVEEGNQGRYVLVDVETGEYKVGGNYYDLSRQFLSDKPDAVICVLRIGYPAVGRIGGRSGIGQQ